jgi:hypothetical protein
MFELLRKDIHLKHIVTVLHIKKDFVEETPEIQLITRGCVSQKRTKTVSKANTERVQFSVSLIDLQLLTLLATLLGGIAHA